VARRLLKTWLLLVSPAHFVKVHGKSLRKRKRVKLSPFLIRGNRYGKNTLIGTVYKLSGWQLQVEQRYKHLIWIEQQCWRLEQKKNYLVVIRHHKLALTNGTWTKKELKPGIIQWRVETSHQEGDDNILEKSENKSRSEWDLRPTDWVKSELIRFYLLMRSGNGALKQGWCL